MERVDEIIAAILSPGASVCPRCGRGFLVPGTVAADRFGVCEACYSRAKSRASEQYADELKAAREYAAARQRKAREKQASGVSGKVITGAEW